MVILQDKILYDKKKRNKIWKNYFSICFPTPEYIKKPPKTTNIKPITPTINLNVEPSEVAGSDIVLEIKIMYINAIRAMNPYMKDFHFFFNISSSNFL